MGDYCIETIVHESSMSLTRSDAYALRKIGANCEAFRLAIRGGVIRELVYFGEGSSRVSERVREYLAAHGKGEIVITNTWESGCADTYRIKDGVITYGYLKKIPVFDDEEGQ